MRDIDLRKYYRKPDGTQGVSHYYTPRELAEMEPQVDADPGPDPGPDPDFLRDRQQDRDMDPDPPMECDE